MPEAGPPIRFAGGLGLAVLLSLLTLPIPSALAAQNGASARPATPPPPALQPDAAKIVEEREAYFYHEVDFGSSASFGPISFILNRGLHFARAKGGSIDVTDIPDGWQTFSTALRRPVWAVQNGGGFRHWATTEVFPLRWDRGASWTVNYTGHLIEAGVGYNIMRERMEASGVPHAALWAHMTVVASSVLSEMYEASQRQESFASHVADFYIFEPAGHIAFSFGGIQRLFGETLNTRIWPHQAALSLKTGEIVNTGLDMVMKIPLPKTEALSLFWRTGMGSDLGLTFHRPGGWDVSFALGFAATDPTADPLTGDELIKVVAAGSFFIDKDDSLILSVHGTRGRGRNLTVNLHPGALPFLPDVGAFLVVTRSNQVQFGLSHLALRGVGLGW